MDITTHTTIERLAERYNQFWDWADEYGEPGYGNPNDDMIVLGSYW